MPLFHQNHTYTQIHTNIYLTIYATVHIESVSLSHVRSKLATQTQLQLRMLTVSSQVWPPLQFVTLDMVRCQMNINTIYAYTRTHTHINYTYSICMHAHIHTLNSIVARTFCALLYCLFLRKWYVNKLACIYFISATEVIGNCFVLQLKSLLFHFVNLQQAPPPRPIYHFAEYYLVVCTSLNFPLPL